MTGSIAIICGGGLLPFEIANKHNDKKIVFILLKEAEIDLNLYTNKTFYQIRVGRVGKMLSILKKHKIRDIYIAGSLKKPSFSIGTLLPDLHGLWLLFCILKLKNKGDNNVLTCIIDFLAKKGISVLTQNVMKSSFSCGKFTHHHKEDAILGIKILNAISDFDIGQGIVVQKKIVLGIEGIEGTDNLINRIKPYCNQGGVFVKSKKQNQTSLADLPTIGLQTVTECINSGICGIFYKDCIILD